MGTPRFLVLAACLALACALSAVAQESAEATSVPASNPAQPMVRDPFWPVGYTPRPADEITPTGPIPILTKLGWPELKVSGTTKGINGEYLALISEVGIVAKGQTVEILRGGRLYRWRITEVDEDGISFKRLDASPVEKTGSGDKGNKKDR